MVKLTKKTEYALMAVQFMAVRPGVQMSAKDLAERLDVPPALMAKVVQALVKARIFKSIMGAGGGYTFGRSTTDVTIADVINAIEGSQARLVDCQDTTHEACTMQSSCTIREPLAILNERILVTLQTMTVADLVRPPKLVSLEVS